MIPVHAEAGKNSRSVMVSRNPFTVPGFRAGAAESGMRYKGRPDIALLVCDGDPDGCTASGVFTKNAFRAAPVEVCRKHLGARKSKAVIINAGIANACTGEEGLLNAFEMARLVGFELGCPEESVLVASTGVIGMQVSVESVAKAMPKLAGSLRLDGWEDAARAIMTTDTVPKMASARVEIGGKTVTIGGIAKGSGMIAPDMATLLAFVCTDAAIDSEALDYWTGRGADISFNSITIDGDTSTNDTLIVLAGGGVGNQKIRGTKGEESRIFGEALGAVLRDLAVQLVLDGEGATKLIEITVSGAENASSARLAAFTIANSPLVKTAFFGEDANWGRIVAAAGRSGVEIDPRKTALFFDDLCVFKAGAPIQGQEIEDQASRIFKQKEIRVRLDLGMGEASHTAFTCDFSFDYIKINASYRS